MYLKYVQILFIILFCSYATATTIPCDKIWDTTVVNEDIEESVSRCENVHPDSFSSEEVPSYYQKENKKTINLLKKGVDASTINNFNTIEWVLSHTALFLEKAARYEKTTWAEARARGAEKLAKLLNAGANPDTVGYNNNPILINVLEDAYNLNLIGEREKNMQETEHIVKLLINAGANSNAIQGDYPNDTALIIAIRKGYLSMVELLLSVGADPFKRNSHNRNAFFYADEIRKEITESQWIEIRKEITESRWMKKPERDRLISVYNQIWDLLQFYVEPSAKQALTQ